MVSVYKIPVKRIVCEGRTSAVQFARATMRKEDRIGLRVSAELKRTLVQISRNEGRSLAQLCEIFLRGATSSYKEEGPKYLQRLLARQKKESAG